MKTFVKIINLKKENETPYWVVFGVLIIILVAILFPREINAQNPQEDIKTISKIVKKYHTATYIRNGNIWDTCYVLERGDDKFEVSKNVLIMRQNKGARNFYSYDIGKDGVDVIVVIQGPIFPSEEFSLKLVGLGAYDHLETQLFLSSRLDQDKSEAYKNRQIFILPLSEVYDFEEKEIFNLPEEFKKELNSFYHESLKIQLAKLNK